MVSVQVLVLEHPPPLQPVKEEPADGEAVKVTTVSLLKADEQIVPQVIPAGLLVTVPLPFPVLLTESMDEVLEVKSAITDAAAVMVTVQLPVPEHPPPLQPAKVESQEDESAAKVTTVLGGKAEVHAAPQATPGGSLITVPMPAPTLLTESI